MKLKVKVKVKAKVKVKKVKLGRKNQKLLLLKANYTERDVEQHLKKRENYKQNIENDFNERL